MTRTETETEAPASVNSVQLCGRVSSAPLERVLPSGDSLLTFRVSMMRAPEASNKASNSRSRQSSDWVDCVVWSARVRRAVLRWQLGDRVELEGALRRRFYRTGTQTSTRLEVEVLAGRRLQRASPG